MSIETGTFDYIVAGAGSAGCVVAARLSESGRYDVLLLEAGGPDRNVWIHVPMGYGRVYVDPGVNWMDESEPEPQLGGRTMYTPHGKVLGGTSSINGMLYMRGHPADYDEWRQRGCVGWGWDSVLPYFRKSEDQERGPNAYHGVGGPLRVSNQPRRMEIAERWLAAAVEAGIPANPDFNGEQQEGVGPFQSTTRDRRRCSTAAAFLGPARNRKNLHVVTGAQASRILVENGRARGVVYWRDGVEHVARVRGEVIVCGGAFNSPQLLQLSGIGPAQILAGQGVPVTHNLPGVGENLQDHFAVRVQFRCTRPITLNEVNNSLWRRTFAGLQYFLLRRGPLASNGNVAGGFVRSDPRLSRPDIQLTFHGWSFIGRTRKGVVTHPFPGFSVNAAHLRPDARGTVRLKTPDPLTPPEIRFNYLRTSYDIEAPRSAMRIIRKIASQPALAPYIAGEVTPGPEAKTDAELEQVVRQIGGSNMHAVGTCRMGSDAEGVVDPRLRVHGIAGLRVADASIMPTLPAGATNAPAIMVGEKASDMILEDAKAA